MAFASTAPSGRIRDPDVDQWRLWWRSVVTVLQQGGGTRRGKAWEGASDRDTPGRV